MRLEKRQGLHALRPPIEFFDRILTRSVSEEELRRWTPWLIRTNLVRGRQEASEPDQSSKREPGGGPGG